MLNISEQERADLQAYITQAPFKLFASIVDRYRKEVVLPTLETTNREDLQKIQGILLGLSGAVKLLTAASIDLNEHLAKKKS